MGDIVQHRKIAVIGGGSWATAIVKILSENHATQVLWWMRSEYNVEHIEKYKHNPEYLSDVQIDLRRVKPSCDLKFCISEADIIVLAVPAAFLAEALSAFDSNDFANKIVVSAVKGMVPERNILYTDFMKSDFGVSQKNLAVIAGPCHAEEVAMEKRSYLTIGASDVDTGNIIADLLKCRYVNCNVVTDILGVEYCAIIKNIVAIACGIAHGQFYGDNYQAVLVSNAMMEIERFVQKIENIERDFVQTAYLGDILVTSYSQFSRNRTFGNMIGRGYSVKSAQFEMNMIAEGFYATKSIYRLNEKIQVDMPVLSSVFNILYQKISPRLEFQLLSENLK